MSGMALVLGHFIHRWIPWTARYNLPSSVLGGFVFASFFFALRGAGYEVVFSEELQRPLMVAFFASLGFSASFERLLAGGKPLLIFFGLTVLILLIQDVVGVLMALALGQSPLFGMMTSSVSLVGGPGTALAFAPVFERAGLPDAAAVGLAAALGGIVLAGLFGGPLSTYLIDRYKLGSNSPVRTSSRGTEIEHVGLDEVTELLIRHLIILLVAMVLGVYVSHWIEGAGMTLPIYIGSMLVAAILRNVDDRTEWIRMRESWLDALGSVALAFFIAMSMMTLDFMKLKGLGFAIASSLAVQVVVVLLAGRYIMFPLLKKNYEAAVLSGGMYGFMMGTAANAMANIETIQKRHGAVPNAALYISLVGACFIDFANAGVITIFLNVIK